MKKTAIIIFLCFISLVTVARDSKEDAINILLHSRTIVWIDSFRDAIIPEIKRIKQEINSGIVSGKDAEILKNRYNASAAKFNLIVTDFQGVLLDKKKRRILIDDPATYEKACKTDLIEAKNYYANEFIGYYNSKYGKETFIFTLPFIIEGIIDLYKTYKAISAELKKMSEEYIFEHFTKKALIPYWDSI